MPDPNSFLQEKLNLSGWSGGKPSTEEEKSYILDYLEKTGTAPTPQQIGNWANQQNYSGFHYTPDSTMGGLGWDTEGDYFKGQGYGAAYGPFAGKFVPTEGGVVVTDEKGRPTMRLPEGSEQARMFTSRGQYVPKEGYPLDIEAMMGPTDVSKYYPQNKPYETPTPEDVLSGLGPTGYKARLYDYLGVTTAKDEKGEVLIDYNTGKEKLVSTGQGLMGRDAPQLQSLMEQDKKLAADHELYLNSLNKQLLAGTITSEQGDRMALQHKLATNDALMALQAKVDTLMTQDNAEKLITQAEQQIGLGTSLEQLPNFNEVKGILGPESSKLWQQGVESSKKARQTEITQRGTGGLTNVDYTQGKGNPQTEYMAFVDSLNLANEYKSWMGQRFGYFYNLWQQSGSGESFMHWLPKALGG